MQGSHLTTCDSCGRALALMTGRQRCWACGSWVDGQYITVAPGNTLPPQPENDPQN